MNAFEKGCRIFVLEDFRFNPLQIDFHIVGNAAVNERFFQRFVGVEQTCVFTHNCNRHFAFRLGDAVHDVVPHRKVGLLCIDNAKCVQHFLVQTFSVVGAGNIIDRGNVESLDHRRRAHVAKQRYFLSLIQGNFAVGTAQQNVGLDAD